MSESDSCENWSREQTLKLIQELQKYPCLFDPLNVNFLNKGFKNEKLNLMLMEIKIMKRHVTIDIIKRKIRTLKAQLWKERRKLDNSKKSGCGTDELYEPTLWCYNELSFLLHCNDAESSSSNLNLSDIGISESEDISENVQLTRKKRKTTAQTKQLEAECHSALQMSREHFRNRAAIQPLGREEEFCRYLCSLLTKIKSEDVFDNLTFEILGLVNKNIREEKQRQQFFTIPHPEQNSTVSYHSPSLTIPSDNHSVYPNPRTTSKFKTIYKIPTPTNDLSNDCSPMSKYSIPYTDSETPSSGSEHSFIKSYTTLPQFNHLPPSPSFILSDNTAAESKRQFHFPQPSSSSPLLPDHASTQFIPVPQTSSRFPILPGPFKDSLDTTYKRQKPIILRNILVKQPTKHPSLTLPKKKIIKETEIAQPTNLLQLAIDHVFDENIIENYELSDEE